MKSELHYDEDGVCMHFVKLDDVVKTLEGILDNAATSQEAEGGIESLIDNLKST